MIRSIQQIASNKWSTYFLIIKQSIQYFQGKFIKGKHIIKRASFYVIIIIIIIIKGIFHYYHCYIFLILNIIMFLSIICNIIS